MRTGQGFDQRRFAMIDMPGCSDNDVSNRHGRMDD
jgi:hypothetical protein